MTPPSTPLADPRRRRAEELVVRGEAAWAEGQHAMARTLFQEAAELEEAVAIAAPTSLPRARTAIAIAAVSLYYRANALARAKKVAYGLLGADEGLTRQGVIELERLVDRCSRESEAQRLVGDASMVPVEMKLEGGEVGVGVALASDVRKRRDALERGLMRTAELEAGVGYRDRGESELDRYDEIRLFEVPPLAASYGVRFFVATGTQQRMESERRVTPEQVVERFFELAKAAEEGPDAVRAMVPDVQYAHAFVSSFAEIAADGEQVANVAFSAPTWRLRTPTVALGPEQRRRLRAAPPPVAAREPNPKEKVLHGILTKVELRETGHFLVLDMGNGSEEIVLIDSKALRLKAAQVRAADGNVRVRTVVQWSEDRRRHILRDVVALK